MFIGSATTLNVVKTRSFLHESCLFTCKEFPETNITPIGSMVIKLCVREHDYPAGLKSVWFLDFDSRFLRFLFVFWLQVLRESCSSWCFLLKIPTPSCHLYFGCNLEAFRIENLWFATLSQNLTFFLTFALLHDFAFLAQVMITICNNKLESIKYSIIQYII